jgi:hypothetical protein
MPPYGHPHNLKVVGSNPTPATNTRAGRASAAPGSALNQISSFNHSGGADRCAAQLQRFWHFWH